MTNVWSTSVGINSTAWKVLPDLLESRDEPPKQLIPIYSDAGRRYRISWQLLAAVNAIETDYGHDLRTSSAGAIGWMQLMPDTGRRYAVKADCDTALSPYDPRDAIFTAARMLGADGAHKHLREAIYDYNQSRSYVVQVVDVAQVIVDHTLRPNAGGARSSTTC